MNPAALPAAALEHSAYCLGQAHVSITNHELDPIEATFDCFAALAESGGRLLQVSTDFVFNGQQGSPYRPEQARDPLGAYGRTKAAGEETVEQLLGPAAGDVDPRN